MVAQHYRWDFIGLSTDTKPTPATSEKVVDGSTFYCSDTSKLYVWCEDQWYEKTATGGGGGTTYTAGDGIDITDDTISVDTDTIQEKLTAGTGIDITDNTISATGGGGGVTILTTADYNYPEGSPDGIALWLLPDGDYQIEASAFLKVYIGKPDAGSPETTGNWISVKFTIFGHDISYEQFVYVRVLNWYQTTSGRRFESISAFSIRKSDKVYDRTPAQGMLIPTADIVSMTTINSTVTSADAYLVTGADVGKSLQKRLVIGLTEAPTNTTIGEVGTLASSIETGTPHLYMCTDITGNNKTWTQLL